jgi:hypothetical protein
MSFWSVQKREVGKIMFGISYLKRRICDLEKYISGLEKRLNEMERNSTLGEVYLNVGYGGYYAHGWYDVRKRDIVENREDEVKISFNNNMQTLWIKKFDIVWHDDQKRIEKEKARIENRHKKTIKPTPPSAVTQIRPIYGW